MPDIFDALPGIEVPVGDIPKGLSSLWSDTAESGQPAPLTEEATATQINFVLHIGFKTPTEDATAQFETAARFSRRYPSRVVVLCPLRDESSGTEEMRAKIYGECTFGKSRDDKRCCEFVILSYPRRQREFLENQVSVSLSTDLPLYYWPHRFSDNSALADYHYLLTRSKRILIDSAVAPPNALAYPWPRPEVVRDLAYPRLLHIRQAIGQFLSRYPMKVLCEGLQNATVAYGSELTAEANALLRWLQERIGMCGKNRATYELRQSEDNGPRGLAVQFTYDSLKTFSWKADLSKGQGYFEADYGSGHTRLCATAHLLEPEAALSEAMFF
jgi:glucose-6-phosphate dehydrogenase assembly protein OpcA